MTLQRAQQILKEYNEWRRGEHEPCDFKYSSLELGAAIDVAVHCMWKVGKVCDIIRFGDGGERE